MTRRCWCVTAPPGVAMREDARLGPVAGLVGGEAPVGHGLVAGGRLAQTAETGGGGGVELAVSAVQQVQLGVSQCRVDVGVHVAVLVAQEPQPSPT